MLLNTKTEASEKNFSCRKSFEQQEGGIALRSPFSIGESELKRARTWVRIRQIFSRVPDANGVAVWSEFGSGCMTKQEGDIAVRYPLLVW